MKHYFATDGNYGDAEDILVCNTDHWTNEMFMFVSECPDLYRLDVAIMLSKGLSVSKIEERLGWTD